MTDRIEDGGQDSVWVPAAFIEFLRAAPVGSGVCCCGDDMASHADPMSCGHVPVDQWDYSLRSWLDQIAARASERLTPRGQGLEVPRG